MATPEMIGKAADLLGQNPDVISQGAKLLGPALVGGLARTASGAGGADALSGLLKMVPSGAAGGDPLTALASFASSDAGAGLLKGVLGDNANSVINGLTRASGIPGLGNLMKMAAPLGIAQISKMMKEKNLDASAVAKELQTEAKELAKSDDPNVKMVMNAFKDVDAQDALKKKVGDKGWQALSVAPAIAAGYVAAAGKGGFLSDPFGAAKEAAALAGAFDPTQIPSGSALVDGIANSIQDAAEKAVDGKLPWDLADLDLSDTAAVKARITDRLITAKDALAQLPAEEQAAYKKMIVDSATKVAEASKEGGFLGLGGKQVSDAELAAINNIKKALGV
jgi:hypothetical protein